MDVGIDDSGSMSDPHDSIIDEKSKILPLMYKDPSIKDGYWICDYDEENRITSVFLGEGEKYTAYMPNIEEVKIQEKLLIGVGWVKCKKPEINI